MNHARILGILVERLRDEADFAITPDDYLRAVVVARAAEGLPAERLKTLLAPVLASSREQQDQFGVIFKRVLEEQQQEQPGDDPPPPDPPHASASLLWPAFWMTLMTFALVVAGVRIATSPDDRTKPGISPPPPAAASIHYDQTTTVVQVANLEQDWWRIAAVIAGVLLIVLFTTLMIDRYRARTRSEPAPAVGPPFQWEIRAPLPPLLFDAVDLARLSRALRGKTESEAESLNVPKTVAAMTRHPAEPQLIYTSEYRNPEYIILIEKYSDADHHSAYFERLVTLLAADGVDLRRFYFEYSPAKVWSTSRHAAITLSDLHRRAPEARLIVFGMPRSLHDPVRGGLEPRMAAELRWSLQVIVTADALPPLELPRTVMGIGGSKWIVALADSILGQYKPRRQPDAAPERRLSAVNTAREARAALSPHAWRWLLACAAYPRLQWELTLALGTRVCAAAIQDAVRELIALPWFRTGEIPQTQRELLLAELHRDETLERIARDAILELLGNTKLEPGSYAERERDLHILTQQIWLQRGDAPALRRTMKTLRGFRLAEIGRDHSLLRFLLSAPGTRIARHLSPRLRRLWFRFGIPGLGRRSLRALPVSACFAALLLASVNWSTDRFTRRSTTKTHPVQTTTYVAVVDTVATDTMMTDTMVTDTSSTFASSSTSSTTFDTIQIPDTGSTRAVPDTTPTASILVPDTTPATTPDTAPATTSSTVTDTSKPIPAEEPLVLISPAGGTSIEAAGDQAQAVVFQWSPDADYTLVIGGNTSQEEKVTKGQKSMTKELPAGDYTWTLETPNASVSPLLKFSVVRRTSFEQAVEIPINDCGQGRLARYHNIPLNVAKGERADEAEILWFDPFPDTSAEWRVFNVNDDNVTLTVSAANPCAKAAKLLKARMRITLEKPRQR